MTPIVFFPGAEQEMLEAARYYESQSPGLGAGYLTEIERGRTFHRNFPRTHGRSLRVPYEDDLFEDSPAASSIGSKKTRLLERKSHVIVFEKTS